MNEFYYILVVFLLIMIIVGMLSYYFEIVLPMWRKTERSLAWHNNYLKTKNGWNVKVGDYRIVSFDSGKTWYHAETITIDPAPQWGFTNLRPIELELLDNIEAWEALGKLGGGLDLRQPDVQKVMERAGFTITEGKKNDLEGP